ncbi:MAG: hypothetical protein ACOC2G_02850 [Bacillota bacterium]
MIIESLSKVFILAVMVEVATNAIKALFPFLKGDRSRTVAACMGIILTLTTGIGILNNLNISIRYEIIDQIITGFVISRGSNAIHDIISVFEDRDHVVI